MKQATLLAAPLLAVSLSPAVLHAQAAEEPVVTPYADIRYRLELVDQGGVPEDATASTLRVKAGVKTGSWQGLSALVEGEAIMRIGPRHYNDTTNGLTRYPVVADPTDVLLNQAYVRFNPGKTVDAIAGFALSQVAPAASYDPLGLIEPRDMRRCEVMESNEFVMTQRFTSQNDDLLTNVLMAFRNRFDKK